MPKKEKSTSDNDLPEAKEDAAASSETSQPEAAPPDPAATYTAEKTDGFTFPIVGIGASAGGLAAFEDFFANMSTRSGMAFVLVQHLSAPHKSILTELVQRQTSMKVYTVTDRIKVEPNCVYIIPPGTDMALLHGELHLIEPDAPRGLRLPIDFFFRSLAQDQFERAIGIVLSGTGTDGTLGLKAIKGQGGMGMAQKPTSAKYDGMPNSAIQTNLVDYILPPGEMPAQLIAYTEHAFGLRIAQDPETQPRGDDSLQKIFILLRAQTGHDFSYYKQNTIGRRIERRMAIHQILKLEDYVRFLQNNRAEVETLFRELLIGVTNFFRDPEAFNILEAQVIPGLFENRSVDQAVRIWVPGCSTGEEAYSIAMLIREAMDKLKREYKVQIFATDIDGDAIQKARSGVYPDGIIADVSQERLARFFRKENSSYHVQKQIRDMVVFAEQNIIGDPPFSKIDLISCRNLLIYMQATLQKKVIPLFHYSLKSGGVLFLGNSETFGDYKELFSIVDRKWKIYRRTGLANGHQPILDFAHPPFMKDLAAAEEGGLVQKRIRLPDLAAKILLERYTPTCVIVDQTGEVLYTHGRTGRYLEPARGEASLNVIRMARDGFRLELTAALRKSRATNSEVSYPGLTVKTNGDRQEINLTVSPVTDPASMSGLMMIFIEDVTASSHPDSSDSDVDGMIPAQDQRLTELEQELRNKEEYLQTIIEELETSNEELKSTNEELQSSNEELQSTNEEMETSKEELQSVNEELVTVNTEHQLKIDQLSQANNDMNNLLASTDVGTIFLDQQLKIQRFTPAVNTIMNLIATDIGRPINHLAVNFVDYDDFVKDAQTVLDTLIPKEVEIKTETDRDYLMRILPYRTVENVIDGVVITFIEFTVQKSAQDALKDSEARFRLLFENTTTAVSIYDLEGRLQVINEYNAKMLGGKPAELIGKTLHDILPEQADFLLTRLVNVAKEKRTAVFEDPYALPEGMRWFRANMQPTFDGSGRAAGVLIVSFDITEQKLATIELNETEARFINAVDQADLIFAQIDADLRYLWVNNPYPDFSSRDLIGKRDTEVGNSDGARELEQLKRQVLEGGEKMRQEITFALSAGDRIYDVIAEPLHDIYGETIGAMTYSLDITEFVRKAEAN
jgi:two-component system CheB/CheR fusion protein